MNVREVFIESFERLPELVHDAVDGLDLDELTFRIDPEANTIAWLVWHLTRVQDDHVADVASLEQVWVTNGWFDRFALPFDRAAHGYGQSPEDVAAVRVPADLLVGYFDDVHAQTARFRRLALRCRLRPRRRRAVGSAGDARAAAGQRARRRPPARRSGRGDPRRRAPPALTRPARGRGYDAARCGQWREQRRAARVPRVEHGAGHPAFDLHQRPCAEQHGRALPWARAPGSRARAPARRPARARRRPPRARRRSGGPVPETEPLRAR